MRERKRRGEELEGEGVGGLGMVMEGEWMCCAVLGGAGEEQGRGAWMEDNGGEGVLRGRNRDRDRRRGGIFNGVGEFESVRSHSGVAMWAFCFVSARSWVGSRAPAGSACM